jgi:hypothetical protein
VERLELLEPVLASYVLNGAERLIDLNDLNWLQPYVRAAVERLEHLEPASVFDSPNHVEINVR